MQYKVLYGRSKTLQLCICHCHTLVLHHMHALLVYAGEGLKNGLVHMNYLGMETKFQLYISVKREVEASQPLP